MKGIFISLSLVFIPYLVLAQEKPSMEDTLREISQDLVALHQQIQDVARAQTAQSHAIPFESYDSLIRITKDNSEIRAGADDRASVVNTVSSGVYPVIDRVDNWYAVHDKSSGISGWVNASNVIPEVRSIPKPIEVVGSQNETHVEQIYEKITKSIKAIQKKYENNPYVKVSGFSVSVAIPPSVTVSFEFK